MDKDCDRFVVRWGGGSIISGMTTDESCQTMTPDDSSQRVLCISSFI